MFASAVVSQVGRFFGVRGFEFGPGECAFDFDGAAFFGRLLGFQNNFEDVVSVFFGGERSFAGVKAFDGVPQAFDLKQVAPQGAIDHNVRVYIATTLEDGGLGD